MEEGDIASFFVKDLGLALASKMCLDQSQTLIEVNNREAFNVRYVQSFARKIEELTAQDQC